MKPDPSQPLIDGRHEAFALARTGRGGATAAYVAHVARDGTGHASCKSAASNLARRPAVAARIEHVRGLLVAQAPAAPAALTVEAVNRILEEVTEVLGTLHDLAQRLAADPPLLLRLRRVLSAHSGRVGHLSAVLSTSAMPFAAPERAQDGPIVPTPIPPRVECQCPPTATSEAS